MNLVRDLVDSERGKCEDTADLVHEHIMAFTSIKTNEIRLKKKRSSKTTNKSKYRYVWYDTYNQRWRGLVVKGELRVYASNRNSDKVTAQILNSRCRELNLEIPNPTVGFLHQPKRRKQKTRSMKTLRRRETKKLLSSNTKPIDLLPRPATELIYFLKDPACFSMSLSL